MDSSLCHFCNKNRFDPEWKYLLKNGIEVCKECHDRTPKKTRYGRERRVQSGAGIQSESMRKRKH